MGIILKYILRSIKEKKFRTFLIVFSVTLSTALFFASLALAGTIEQTFMEKIKKYIGTADIIIQANQKSPFWLFRLDRTNVVRERLEYAVGAVETNATYKTQKESVNLDLKGFDPAELQRMNPYILAEQRDLAPFEGRKLIVSKKTAEKYHFRLGANIELKINSNRYRFKVVGIAQPMGLFQADGQSNMVVVPREVLARLFDAPGRVSCAYLKLKDSAQLGATLAALTEAYPRYTVREAMPRAELRQYTQAITIPFLIMLVLVLFISVFIIYSSFKVITRERLPVIGTFRSIGATRKMTNRVLFAESIFYGVVGGVLGCLLGWGILYVMAAMLRPEWIKNVSVALTYSPLQLIAAFLIAVILPLLSSLFPIVKIARTPVKEIIFSTMELTKKEGFSRPFLGLCFLALVFTAPRLAPQDWALAVDIVCMLLAITAIILLMPWLTSGFLKGFEVVYEYVLGNEGLLAAKNLRENKSILNNIALLAIGLASLLMINTLSFSVVKEVANFFKDARFEIWMGCGDADRKLAGIIKSVNGVSGVCGVYGVNGIELQGRKEKLNLIHGVGSGQYFDYWNIPVTGDRNKLLAELDADRNIMLSYILKEKLGVRQGDVLTLKFQRGQRAYKVIGFFNSLMWNGSFALVAERFLKSDAQLQYYDNIFIKTDRNPNQVVKLLQQKLARHYPWLETMANLSRQNAAENQKMFMLLQGFAIMTLLIGMFGIFNNLMISFLERKRSLAMMRSVGMSQKQTLKIILIESLTGGLIGGGIGVLTGTALIWLLPFVLRAINQVVPIHYVVREYLVALLFGVVIMVGASVGPALKSSRLNIIEAIKYE
jgi:putative ABC transport system permease protein